MAGMVIYRGVGPHVRVVSSGRLCREETGRDHSVLQTGVILPFPPHIYTYIIHIYIYIYICSGGQGEFNEVTPEFIGEMVYS